MYTISSEQIIGSYAVKYKTLTNLINTEYAGSDANNISLFIDCTSMFKSITSQPVSCNNPYSVAASVINLCAHYRNFFEQYYQVSAKIHIIVSYVGSDSINAKNVPGYKKSYSGNNPAVNQVIQDAIIILNTLVPYINDMEFISIPYEFGVYVYEVLQAKQEYPALILTKDPYNYQLVSDDGYLVKVLRPRKENGEDVSYIIQAKNVYSAVCIARKVGYVGNNLSPSLLSIVYALSRVPERNISSLHQLPSVIKGINSLAMSGVIMNERTTDIGYVCEMLGHKKLLKVNDIGTIINRFRAIDIESQWLAYGSDMLKYEGILNLYDPEAVKEISMKYFKDYPLDLNVL